MRKYPNHMSRKVVRKTTFFAPEHEGSGGNDGVLVDRNGNFVCPVGDEKHQWHPVWDVRRK